MRHRETSARSAAKRELLGSVLLLGIACTAPGGPARAEAKPYEVTLVPPAGVKVGSAAETKVRLVPRGGYKVNLEYPIKLEVKGPQAAAPVQQTLGAKQARKLDKGEAVFTPSATLSAAGQHRFSATFKFSVCTDKQCELKTETLNWTVTATR